MFLKVNLCYFIFLKVIRVYKYCWRALDMSLISCHPAIKYFTEIVDLKSFLKFVSPLFSFLKVHLGNKHSPNSWIHVSQSDHSNYLLLYFILLKRILWNNIRSSHRMCPTEKAVLLKISQYSQENTCVGVPYLQSCKPSGLQLY